MKPTGGERSNPQAEARNGERVSRNNRELASASLHKAGVANHPDLAKPAIVGEEVPVCNRRTPRGDWRRRARKEMPRNLRDPFRLKAERESDDPIVAGKGLIRLERRGSAVNMQPRK